MAAKKKLVASRRTARKSNGPRAKAGQLQEAG